MSDLNLEKLLSELSDEPVEVDWSAPEAGQFPPAVKPGTYDFIFRLREDQPFDSVTIEGLKYLSVIFDTDVQVNGESKTITYQRVNTKAFGTRLSGAAELARSLSAKPENNPPTNADWIETFQAASGRARGRGEVAWRFYDKATGITYSTSPRKRKGVKDSPWPRNADGSFSDTITASDGSKHYGQAEFIRFFSPAAQADTASA